MEMITPYQASGMLLAIMVLVTIFGLLIGAVIQTDSYFKWLGIIMLLGFSLAVLIALVGFLLTIQWVIPCG